MRHLEAGPKEGVVNAIITSLAKLQLLGHLFSSSARKHLAAVDVKGAATALSLRAMERALVCPLHGYRSPEEYYESARPVVPNIDTPLLMVHARDDPVIRVEDLPMDQLRANKQVRVVISPRGGHLGWASNPFPGGPSWVDDLCVQFLCYHLRLCTLYPRSKM